MTTRNGKIARLPAHIRDGINRSLDDGNPASPIAEGSNGLPEVQEMLAQHFGGRPISQQNISEWRRGGFLEWRAERELFHSIGNSEHGGKVAGTGLTAESLIQVFLGRCAAALDLGEAHIERLEPLYPMTKTLLAIQKNELAAERIAISRDRLMVKASRLDPDPANPAPPQSSHPAPDLAPSPEAPLGIPLATPPSLDPSPVLVQPLSIVRAPAAHPRPLTGSIGNISGLSDAGPLAPVHAINPFAPV